jgi:hypothetical protein
MLAPPNRGSINSTHILGTHVPVKEPSTASKADLTNAEQPPVTYCLAIFSYRSAEALKDFYQVCQSLCVHFSHGIGTMYLHRSLAQPQLGSYFLIQVSRYYPCDHFSLTGTE